MGSRQIGLVTWSPTDDANSRFVHDLQGLTPYYSIYIAMDIKSISYRKKFNSTTRIFSENVLIHAMSHLSMLFSAKVFKVIVWTCTASILLLSGLSYWLQSIWDWLILCEIHVQLFLVLLFQKVSQYLRGGRAN